MRRWEYVARNLQKKLKKSIQYSAGSCQKRYVALMNETARVPIELDDNPEQRLVDRQNRSIEVLQRMHEAEAAEFEMKTRRNLKKMKRSSKPKSRMRSVPRSARRRRRLICKRPQRRPIKQKQSLMRN